ncbi:hypothetical protein FOZ62_013429, partial [Perkinsus olseni]
NPFTVTAAFSKTASVIEYLNIMVPTVADITVRGAPHHTVGNNLHINAGSSLPEKYAELDTEIEYHHDNDTIIVTFHDTGVPPVTMHREVDYPHPIDLYAGGVDLNGDFFRVTASFSHYLRGSDQLRLTTSVDKTKPAAIEAVSTFDVIIQLEHPVSTSTEELHPWHESR